MGYRVEALKEVEGFGDAFVWSVAQLVEGVTDSMMRSFSRAVARVKAA